MKYMYVCICMPMQTFYRDLTMMFLGFSKLSEIAARLFTSCQDCRELAVNVQISVIPR